MIQKDRKKTGQSNGNSRSLEQLEQFESISVLFISFMKPGKEIEKRAILVCVCPPPNPDSKITCELRLGRHL